MKNITGSCLVLLILFEITTLSFNFDSPIPEAGEPTIFSERKIVEFGPNDRVVNITIGTNATLFESTKVNILCPVQAYPFRLRVRWRAVNVETTRGIRRYGYYGSDLRIQSARIGHSGTYVCTGEAYLGSDSESSTIKVIGMLAFVVLCCVVLCCVVLCCVVLCCVVLCCVVFYHYVVPLCCTIVLYHYVVPLCCTILFYHCVVPLCCTIVLYHCVVLCCVVLCCVVLCCVVLYHYFVPLCCIIVLYHCVVPLCCTIVLYHCVVPLCCTIVLFLVLFCYVAPYIAFMKYISKSHKNLSDKASYSPL